jgi:hypothetical protein
MECRRRTMPFMSRYKLSNSAPFGLGPEMSTGTFTSTPSSVVIVLGCSSSTLATGKYWREHSEKSEGSQALTNPRILLAEPAEQSGNTLFGCISISSTGAIENYMPC